MTSTSTGIVSDQPGLPFSLFPQEQNNNDARRQDIIICFIGYCIFTGWLLGGDDELLGGAGALLEEDGSAGDDAVDDLLGVVADGDELEVFVVTHTEQVL